jgi:hypothetical protein
MDALALLIAGYYIYTGMVIIFCLLMYFWIPRTIKLVFTKQREKNEKTDIQ